MGTSLLVSCLKGTKNSANDKCLLAESCRSLCIEIQTDTAGTTLFPSGSVFSKNCTSGENKCLLYRCSPKKTVPFRSVNYVTMNYDDRIPRTRQAFLLSSACVAAPERMATRPLCAFIYRVTGQDAGTPEIMESPHVLNSTNDSEILQRGGYAQALNFRKVAGGSFSSGNHPLLKNHTRQAVSPPRGNTRAETFIYPRMLVASQNLAASIRGFLYLYQMNLK